MRETARDATATAFQPPNGGEVVAAADALPRAVEPRCLNCGEALTGRYCAACGQKETERDPRLRELAHEAADELLHWDGKLVATLGALFRRPGFLTNEYLAGRRARYVSPLRLYLTASVVYFAALALVPRSSAVRFDFGTGNDAAAATATTQGPPDANGPAPATTSPANDDAYRATKRNLFGRVARDPAKFTRSFMENRSKAMFVLLPFFALALRVLYRRRGRYPAHFIFALHFHAFAFFVAGVITLPEALSARFDVLEPFAFTAIAGYLVVALRRAYGGGWAITLAKTGALALGYLVAFAATIVALLALTALTFA